MPKISRTTYLTILGIIVLAVIAFAIASATSRKAATTAEGCRPGDKFSITTGKPCSNELPEPCQGDDIYNIKTGELCPGKTP